MPRGKPHRHARSSWKRLKPSARHFRVAQDLSARIEALASELNSDAATPAVVEKLAAVDRARAIAEAELAGHSAYVDVRLEPGGKDKLSIGGAPLAESRRFAVVEPLEIRIDGIAAITVSTAQAGQGAKLKAKSASAASEIDETLRRLGVATLAEARERAAARAAKVKDLDEARARFSEIAPAGLQEPCSRGGEPRRGAEKHRSAKNVGRRRRRD